MKLTVTKHYHVVIAVVTVDLYGCISAQISIDLSLMRFERTWPFLISSQPG